MTHGVLLERGYLQVVSLATKFGAVAVVVMLEPQFSIDLQLILYGIGPASAARIRHPQHERMSARTMTMTAPRTGCRTGRDHAPDDNPGSAPTISFDVRVDNSDGRSNKEDEG